MRMRLGRTVAAVGLAALAVAACSDDDGGKLSVDLDPPRTTTTEPTGATGTIEAVPDGLEPGLHFGYLRTIVAGHNEIVGTFDPAELLTGAEAEAAAEAAGEEPLDFFIRNTDDGEQVPILVDPEADVLDVRYGSDECCTPVATTPAQFVADREAAGEEQTIVRLTVVAGGLVTRIEEVYFP